MPDENQSAARILHQRVEESKQILISIINQVHIKIASLFFHVDKDKLVVVAEFQLWLVQQQQQRQLLLWFNEIECLSSSRLYLHSFIINV